MRKIVRAESPTPPPVDNAVSGKTETPDARDARKVECRSYSFSEAELDEGDAIEVTCGKELYSLRKFSTFEVGPVKVSVRLRPGESAGHAYARASIAARVMFETEFELKKKEAEDRLKEIDR